MLGRSGEGERGRLQQNLALLVPRTTSAFKGLYIDRYIYTYKGASQVLLVVKNLPAIVRDVRPGFDPRVRTSPWRRVR